MSLVNTCIQKAFWNIEQHLERFRHYSFVIQGNEILAMGRNCQVDHNTIYPRRTLHAEYVAWKKAKHRIFTRRPWYMINVRIGNDMSLRLSRPCDVCIKLLSSVGCEKVIYTIDTKNTGTYRL